MLMRYMRKGKGEALSYRAPPTKYKEGQDTEVNYQSEATFVIRISGQNCLYLALQGEIR